jgi:hypothetical protein
MKKARPHRRASATQLLVALDQAFVCCGNIATLAGLLAAIGLHRDNQPLNAGLASDAGELILQELRRLEALLGTMRKA